MRPIDANRLKETIKKLDVESPDIKTARIVSRTIQEIFPQIIDDEPTIEVKPDKDWISVKDRLPENDGLYIVCKTVRGHRISFEAHWKGNEWLSVVKNNQLDYITHWQPLPEPPKGE